jgi:hypothetical protein
VDGVPEALGEGGEHGDPGGGAGQSLQVDPGLEQPGGELQVFRAGLQGVEAEPRHLPPVGALEIDLPDPLRERRVVLAPRRLDGLVDPRVA